jgi:hypothetical protein
MAPRITLPTADGGLEVFEMRSDVVALPTTSPTPISRKVYAAAHVVVNPLAPGSPIADAAIDWDATLAYRHHLWDLGFGVAEAMDTAHRGMGLPPAVVPELIRRSLAEASSRNALIACAAATDSLPAGMPASLWRIVDSYRAQCDAVEAAGGHVIVMASRHLAAAASGPTDYEMVYRKVLAGLQRPAIIHWLGTAFDPALEGYWGSYGIDEATKVLVRIVEDNADKVDGIKVSILDAQKEIALRRLVPGSVRIYTGDDFNYPTLIRGDETGHSDALLGIFDAIAPVAAVAFQSLDAADADAFERILAPTVPLSRKLFEVPTRHYKTGIVFLAYLRGYQSHFRMVSGLESARSAVHLAAIFKLADAAGLLPDQDTAVSRMRPVMQLAGVFEGHGL